MQEGDRCSDPFGKTFATHEASHADPLHILGVWSISPVMGVLQLGRSAPR